MEAQSSTSVVLAQEAPRVENSTCSDAVALTVDRLNGFSCFAQLAGAPDSGNRSFVVAGSCAEAAADGGGGGAAGILDAAVPVRKKKRGRPPRSQAKTMTMTPSPVAKRAKKEDEDVCFICFDGGTLVLCDRRDCPKAYHPACVKRDETFFRGRVRWNCGWHLCNVCQRNALFMCYTCPYSLCKGCVKQADIFCVRRNKGFCKTCMTTIMLIENIAQENKESAQVDFDDKTSFEYFFKVYWILLKQKESLTLDELTQASNPWRQTGLDHKDDSSQKTHEIGLSKASAFINAPRQLESNVPKRRNIQSHPKLPSKESQVVKKAVDSKIPYLNGVADWASKELLEFVALMKNGDTSVLTQFEVQALLLDYIRTNNLRDPHRKCQIICDRRLENLFGKDRVGHFEMLKLLEYHFKGEHHANGMIQAAVMNPVASQLEPDGSEVMQTTQKDKKRHSRRRIDEKAEQTNLANYAAIDVHNINLVYLKRSLIESLLEDSEKFHDKVVGSILRIRISDNDQKPDIYRLVRVVGTGKAAEPYKSGDKTTDVILKILNLNKIEDVTIDAISNQEFSEDECRRLRRSMKCEPVARMTVGEIQEKAIALQVLKVNDLLEAEILKLNHLRDQASEMGHRKELRECVEKLKLLNKPEERQRRTHAIPEVHVDPRMDPDHVSDEDTGQLNIKKEDGKKSTKLSNYNAKVVELNSPKQDGDTPVDTMGKTNLPMKSQSVEEENTAGTKERDCDSPQTLEGAHAVSRILVELRNGVDRSVQINHHAAIASQNLSQVPSDASTAPSSRGMVMSSDSKELEKIWHYKDPSGKTQGPFCLLQLRKWNSNGYFPIDLRIWRVAENQDQSVLLTDALNESVCVVGLRARSDSSWAQQLTNEECISDLNKAAPSSNSDEQHLGTRTIGIEIVGLNDYDHSPVEKGKASPEKTFLDNGAPGSSHAPTSSSVGAMDLKPDVEISELHSPTPKIKNQDLNAEPTQTKQLAVSVVLGQDSGSSWSSSSEGLNSLDLPRQTSEAEQDFKHPIVKKEQSVTEDVPVQDLGTNVSVVSCRIPDKVDAMVAEAQLSVASNVPGQSSGTSWSTISIGTQFSGLPTSASVQDIRRVKIEEVVNNQYATPNISSEDSVLTWSTASSIVGSVVQLPDSTGPWIGYSAIHAKPSLEQMDCGLASGSAMRQTELVSDYTTPTPESYQLAASPTHVDYASRWHGMEPIELSTLGDESVSDLLSEVEALESLHGAASHISRNNCMGDSIDSPGSDCFNPLVGLSPTLDPGKHDATSSTGDMQFHSHSIRADGRPGGFTIDINDLPDTCGAHASTSPEVEVELSPTFLSVQQQLFSLAHPTTNLPSLSMGLNASGSPTTEEEAKPSYVSADLQNIDSLAHSPAPLFPLPIMSQNSTSPGATGEVMPGCVSMQRQNQISQDHAPVPSQPMLPTSSPIISEPEADVNINPRYISIPQLELLQRSLSLAQPLPTINLNSSFNLEPVGELNPVDTSLPLLYSPSPRPPPSSSSPAPSPLSPQPSVPTIPLVTPLSPEEEGELRPLVFVSEPLPASNMVSVSNSQPQKQVKLTYDPIHRKELVDRSDHHLPLKLSLSPINLEQVLSPGEGELKPDDIRVPQLEFNSPPHVRNLNLNTSDGSLSAGSQNVDLSWGSFAGTGSDQGMNRGNVRVLRSSSLAGSDQGVGASQQLRHNNGNGGRHSGPKDRSRHGVDSGSIRNTRSSWNRQGSFGRDGGSSRPHTPRGKRLCKFYESGYCKKGASCSYLHP
ncbi:hypothetical protein Dimus_014121 [Dionaea muscipula]